MGEGSGCLKGASVFERKTRNRNRGGRTKGKKQKQRSSLSILNDAPDEDADDRNSMRQKTFHGLAWVKYIGFCFFIFDAN